MIRAIDRGVRRACAWPLLLIGIAMAQGSEWAIRAGAWLADIETEGE